MFKESEIGIGFSEKYAVGDYTILNLSINSSAFDWDRAIDLFQDRIESRYLNQIHELAKNVESNAFSIMAIESLLIEVFLQFRKGWDLSPTGQSRKEYVKFIHQHLNDEFCLVSDFQDEDRRHHEHLALENLIACNLKWKSYSRKKLERAGIITPDSSTTYIYKMSIDPAERFYCDIRCGILHSGQTKGETGLCVGRQHAVEIEDGILFVSVDQFIKTIDRYFNAYLDELKDLQNVELRKLFIKKMDFICYRYVKRR